MSYKPVQGRHVLFVEPGNEFRPIDAPENPGIRETVPFRKRVVTETYPRVLFDPEHLFPGGQADGKRRINFGDPYTVLCLGEELFVKFFEPLHGREPSELWILHGIERCAWKE